MSRVAALRGAVVRTILALTFLVAGAHRAQASVILTENFDNIANLSASGWTLLNLSSPNTDPFNTSWFQGTVGVFPSQAGAPNSYIGANFAGADYGGNISEWLITPVLTLDNLDTLRFFTRTPAAFYGDQLEVRLSTAGAGSTTGGTDTSVGDFTNLLLTLNSNNPSAGPYPEDWTEYALTLSGLAGPTSARLAFRYVANDTSVNGNYIGIDTVTVESAATATPVPEPGTLTLSVLGLMGAARSWRKRRAARG